MSSGSLSDIRVLDLSRVLAGPWATQILGDLGADDVKVERPGEGDGTRAWGPPFLKDTEARDTTESAYYLSANRNKRSVAIDFARPDGQALIRALLARSDVLVENYQVGTLARYGLGVAIADIMAGMYAAIAILAALRHRDATGRGQFADIGLLDCQIAWLASQGQSYLTSGVPPPRVGNAHPNIVPYDTYATRDGHVIVAVGSDRQFRALCDCAGLGEIANDPRFAVNEARVLHCDELTAILRRTFTSRTTREWLEGLEAAHVPADPVHTTDQVFGDPHVRARGAVVEMEHPLSAEPIALLGRHARKDGCNGHDDGVRIHRGQP